MKKIISTILAIMMLTSVFAGISVSAEVISAPAVHMQEKVVYHETFEDFETNPNPDFELNSWFPVTYEERGDGNGKALVMSATDAGASEEYKGGWVRFLHNAAGDRKLTLHEYLDDSDITEISVDFYAPTLRNQSINIATTGWQWRHSLDISANGYIYYADWELVNNTRKVDWEDKTAEAKDIQKISKEFAKNDTWMQTHYADFEAGKWYTIKFVVDKQSRTTSAYLNDTLIGRRVYEATQAPLGLLTIEDESLAEPNECYFKIDNFKIVQKNYASFTETFKEDFTGDTSVDTSKHAVQWWAEGSSVVETGDSEHGNALKAVVRPTATNANQVNGDDWYIRFFNGDKLSNYMTGDISVVEADFKLPAARRMAISCITPSNGWGHHSVIISQNNWACFVGNQGSPNLTTSNANKWQTNTLKQMKELSNGGYEDFLMGFPVTNVTDWHKIRFVRDVKNSTLTAYLDGVCLGTRTLTEAPIILAFTSQTQLAKGTEVMMIDNVKVGNLSDSTAPSLSITDTEGKAVSSVTAGNTYYAKMDGIKNNTNADKKMQLFVAAYDENNCFLGIDSYAYTVPANTSLASEGEALGVVQLTAPEGAKKMKVFAWSDFETNIPICATAEVK